MQIIINDHINASVELEPQILHDYSKRNRFEVAIINAVNCAD
jgi:hypothetical protein